jgi:hypothetical protein
MCTSARIRCFFSPPHLAADMHFQCACTPLIGTALFHQLLRCSANKFGVHFHSLARYIEYECITANTTLRKIWGFAEAQDCGLIYFRVKFLGQGLKNTSCSPKITSIPGRNFELWISISSDIILAYPHFHYFGVFKGGGKKGAKINLKFNQENK